MRAWRKDGAYSWRCEPWAIAKVFNDGCTLFVLSKDGESQPIAHFDELADAMAEARRREGSQ